MWRESAGLPTQALLPIISGAAEKRGGKAIKLCQFSVRGLAIIPCQLIRICLQRPFANLVWPDFLSSISRWLGMASKYDLVALISRYQIVTCPVWQIFYGKSGWPLEGLKAVNHGVAAQAYQARVVDVYPGQTRQGKYPTSQGSPSEAGTPALSSKGKVELISHASKEPWIVRLTRSISWALLLTEQEFWPFPYYTLW